MNSRQFSNALRILRSMDVSELRSGGVVDENWGTPEASDRDQIAAFVADPFREVLRMPDANYERLWALVEAYPSMRGGAEVVAWHFEHQDGDGNWVSMLTFSKPAKSSDVRCVEPLYVRPPAAHANPTPVEPVVEEVA